MRARTVEGAGADVDHEPRTSILLDVAMTATILARARMLILAASCLGVGGLVTLACGPDGADEIPPDAAERYADAICGTYERCECLGEWFANDTECHAAAVEQFRLTADWPSVEFNNKCFEKVLTYLENDECQSGLSSAWEHVPCLVFEGTIKSGESCTPLAALPLIEGGGGGALVDDTCAPPQTCVAGRCQSEPGPAVGLGASCVLETGARCDDPMLDLYCATDGTCHETVVGNEACDTPYACEDPGHYCAGQTKKGEMGVCSERIAEGDACVPGEILSCESAPEVFCDQEGLCEGTWPGVCGLFTRAPGFFLLRDWVPLR